MKTQIHFLLLLLTAFGPISTAYANANRLDQACLQKVTTLVLGTIVKQATELNISLKSVSIGHLNNRRQQIYSYDSSEEVIRVAASHVTVASGREGVQFDLIGHEFYAVHVLNLRSCVLGLAVNVTPEP